MMLDEVLKRNLGFSKPFFLGIGGSGMSSLAHILIDAGLQVYGYDGKKSPVTEALEKKGAVVFSSLHEIPPEGDYDAVIYSSAIRLDSHPIADYFKKKGLSFHHRSSVLHDCFRHLRCIAVAGSHGKTTTTAMTGFVLNDLGLSPSVMVGGDVAFLEGIGGRFTPGKFGVFESDESDGTFLNHRAPIRVLTNIDEDHLDFYKSREKLLEAFAQFIESTSEKMILNLDDVGIGDCLPLVKDKSKILGFYQVRSLEEISEEKSEESGVSDSIPYSITGRVLHFVFAGKKYEITSNFPGLHYLRNSLAAALACIAVGIDPGEASLSVSKYTGVRRRLELLGSRLGVRVYDDYGHHPTEVRAVLSSLQELSDGKGKAIVVFQPHRFTRTQNLYREFAESLDSEGTVFLLPIYSAGEDPIPGVSTKLIADEMRKKPILLSGDLSSDLKIIQGALSEGDVLVSLGAGNVRDWALRFLVS